MLVKFTAVLDLTGLAVGLWLAFYVLARGFRSALTRRAFAVLTLMSLFFYGAFNNIYTQVPGSAAWRAVYLIMGLFFWYDLTCLLLTIPDRTRIRPLRIGMLIFAGTTSIVLLVVPGAFRGEVGNALNIGQMSVDIPFILYGLYMIVIAVAMLYNHTLIRRAGRAHNYRFFFTATLLIAFNVGHGVLSLAVLPPQSRIIQDGLILAAMFVLGYSVARHQTFVERRTTFRDFQVSGLTVLGFAALFGLAGLALDFSPRELSAMIALALIALGSYDFVRVVFEGVLLRQVSQLRGQLLETARSASVRKDPGEGFTAGLKSLCAAIEAESGLIGLPVNGGQAFRIAASTGEAAARVVLPGSIDAAQDLIDIESESGSGSGSQSDLCWIAPCTWQGELLGVAAVGRRVNGGAYNEGDLDLLTEFADQVALLLHLNRLQTSKGDQLSALAREYQADQVRMQTGGEAIVEKIKQRPDKEIVGLVEDALRNLADYAHLGSSPLVRQFGIEGETHLVQGRALRERLIELLRTLRPPGERPGEPLPREWYSYAVLHDAYVEDVPNREIMARLYISEGTFSRTRRNAIRAIARAVVELRD